MLRFICLWVFVFCISSHAFCGDPDREFERAIVNGAKVSMGIHVIDDDGVPVDKAKVHVLLGMNFREKANFIDGFTSTNGEFQIEGKTTGNEIEISVSKDGYYRSKVSLCLITRPGANKVKDGKWQPWGERKVICLRRIANPVKMPRFNCHFDVPRTNEWIGFDLERCEWVHPYGRGIVADFELFVTWDGFPKPTSRDCTMGLRMTGDGSGGYFFDKVTESDFPYPYLAKTNETYSVRSFDWKERESGILMRDQSFWNQRDFVFRTRCVVDESGKIREACYGSIRKLEVSPGSQGRPILRTHYVFNTLPNKVNLEEADVANRTYKHRALVERLEKERREKEEKTLWGGVKKMFGAP